MRRLPFDLSPARSPKRPSGSASFSARLRRRPCRPPPSRCRPCAPALSAKISAAVARGAYVFAAADCASCHTDKKNGGAPLAGGRALATPFGTFFSPNITPDKEQGIGSWSEAQFQRALRQGLDDDGDYLFPVFPYPSFTGMSDQDIADLYAYLMTQAPSPAPDKAHAVKFPFGVRRLQLVWRKLFFVPGPLQPVAGAERRMEPRPLSRRGRGPLRGMPHAAQFPGRARARPRLRRQPRRTGRAEDAQHHARRRDRHRQMEPRTTSTSVLANGMHARRRQRRLRHGGRGGGDGASSPMRTGTPSPSISSHCRRCARPANSEGTGMDFGIRGKTALVCAASQGLGRACAMALAGEGVDVVITARGRERLEATAAEIRCATGAKVTAVAGDITTPEGRAAALAALPSPDILVTNAGGPPPGDFRNWDRADLDQGARRQHADADRAHQGDDRPHDRAQVRARRQHHLGHGEGAHRSARAFERRARRLDRLHRRPRAQSGRAQRHHQQPAARRDGDRALSPERASTSPRAAASPSRRSIASASLDIPARRIGDPDEFGAACAFLCSARAGYIVAQNLLIDGGQFPGTF